MDDMPNTIELAMELTIAWLGNPNTRAGAEGVPSFLNAVHGALETLTSSSAAELAEITVKHMPAVSVRKSLSNKDYILSMIDGKPYKALRRHLRSHGLTPDEYRTRYNLRSDYPMVAESYSEARRTMAKSIGLGRKPNAAKPESPASRQRKRTPATAG